MARREAINEVRPMLNDLDKAVGVVDDGLDAVEKAADIATDVVDKGVHVAVEETRKAVHWLRNPKTAGVVILVVTAAGASYVTWKITKRHLAKKYDERLENEVESARKYYGRMAQKDESPQQRVAKVSAEEAKQQAAEEAAADAMREYQGKDGVTSYNKVEPKVDTPTVQSNVFVESAPDADFDLTEELKHRSPDVPYVISKDEFMEGVDGYSQVTITYYEGDDILADEKDEPMDEIESTVGQDNLQRFGHGSGDKSIVYVRNERNQIDFEILHSSGKFSEEVHGFLQHSDRPMTRHPNRSGRRR